MRKRHITTIISDREVDIKHIAGVTREDNHIDGLPPHARDFSRE